MFHAAGHLVRFTGINAEHLGHEPLQCVMAMNDVLGDAPPLVSQRNQVVGRIVDQAERAEAAQRSCYRGGPDVEKGRDIFGPGSHFHDRNLIDGLEIIFLTGSEVGLRHCFPRMIFHVSYNVRRP